MPMFPKGVEFGSLAIFFLHILKTKKQKKGFLKKHLQLVEPLGKVHHSPGGMLACFTGSHNLVAAVSFNRLCL